MVADIAWRLGQSHSSSYSCKDLHVYLLETIHKKNLPRREPSMNLIK